MRGDCSVELSFWNSLGGSEILEQWSKKPHLWLRQNQTLLAMPLWSRLTFFSVLSRTNSSKKRRLVYDEKKQFENGKYCTEILRLARRPLLCKHTFPNITTSAANEILCIWLFLGDWEGKVPGGNEKKRGKRTREIAFLFFLLSSAQMTVVRRHAKQCCCVARRKKISSRILILERFLVVRKEGGGSLRRIYVASFGVLEKKTKRFLSSLGKAVAVGFDRHDSGAFVICA